MASVWSCPDCGTDLWCPACERLWSPRAVADWDDSPGGRSYDSPRLEVD